MKVALLIDTLGSGGAQRQIVNLACGLTDRGIDCNLIYYHNKNHYEKILAQHKVRVTLVEKKSKFDIGFFMKLRSLILEGKYDVLNTYLFMPNYIGIMLKLSVYGSIKLLISERSCESYTGKIFKKLRFLYRNANLITANSNTQTQVLKKLLPSIEHKISYMPNSIDLAKFTRDEQIESERTSFKVVAVGRIEKNKNPLLLIKAISILKAQHDITIEVCWVGALQDTLVNRNYFKECNDLIMAKGLSNKWEWAGEVTDVKTAYDSADAIYHGSFGEGFPNVVCEGLSMSSIVLASNICDHPIIIEHGVNGFLFNPNCEEDLCKVLLEITSMPRNLIQKIKRNARLTAEDRFSYDKVLKMNINAFESMLGNNKLNQDAN